MVKDSIILTLFNRPRLALENVIFGLLKNDLADTELVIIDDGSDEEHLAAVQPIVEFLRARDC